MGTLTDLVRALDAGSRHMELASTLPTGRRVRIAARSCRFEGTLVWTTTSTPTSTQNPRPTRQPHARWYAVSEPSTAWESGRHRSRSAHDGTRGWHRPDLHRHTVRTMWSDS